VSDGVADYRVKLLAHLECTLKTVENKISNLQYYASGHDDLRKAEGYREAILAMIYTLRILNN